MKGPQSLQAGDIIYIARGRRAPGPRAAARPSRVGVVFHGAGGWMLAQGAGRLARYRPLRDVVAGSSEDWFVVRRLQRRLSAAELGALRAACDRRQGSWYRTLRPEATRDFHSRFVEQVYAEAGIDLAGAEFSAELLRCTAHAARPRQQRWSQGLNLGLAWLRRTLAAALRPATQQTGGQGF